MAEPIYKILADAAYDAAKSEGRFLGTSDDLRDGFIHFSAGHQVAETWPSTMQDRKISCCSPSIRIGWARH